MIPPSDRFTMVNSEGTEIKGSEEMGLLLYKGGTVCNYGQSQFNFKAADAICKELNFTRAIRWTIQESFGIQSNYKINLAWCSGRNEEVRTDCNIFGNCNWHSDDIFLQCTGR